MALLKSAALVLILCLSLGSSSAQRSTTKFPASLRMVKLRLNGAGKRFVVNVAKFTGPFHAAAPPGPFNISRIPIRPEPEAEPDETRKPQRSVPQAPSVTFGAAKVAASTAFSYSGINAFQSGAADNGNNLVSEPPDQGLCVGNGYVMETNNYAVRIFKQSQPSAPLTIPMSLNQFYGYAPFDPPSNQTNGPWLFDPSCLFDGASRRWFHVVSTNEVNRRGDVLGPNYIDIAVSVTARPTGKWMFYKVPVQNDGTEGTVNHRCKRKNGRLGPCFGDFPHIGTNADGLYVTTNEFGVFGGPFETANLRAFPKRALIKAKRKVSFLEFTTPGAPSAAFAFGTYPGTTLMPAKYPPTAPPPKGVQYFLSTDINIGFGSNGILLWKLSRTAALSAKPLTATSLRLRATLLRAKVEFSMPPPANQPTRGRFPLGRCLNKAQCAKQFVIGLRAARPLKKRGVLDSGDNRMLSAYFAKGKVWGTYSTGVAFGSRVVAGIGWVGVRPVKPSIRRQGTLAVENNHVIMPALAVNSKGQGAMGFTLVGDDHFPSAAYAAFDGFSFGKVVVAGAGRAVQDGISEYSSFLAPRWGDYGAAAVDGEDNVWLASEFIESECSLARFRTGSVRCPAGTCGCTRSVLANWATRITKVKMP